MTHSLVQICIEEYGATPICPEDHRVDFMVLADVRGQQDPNKFGHQWVERGVPYWCVSSVIPAEEAEKEVANS